MTVYEYYNRAKCLSCETIMWNNTKETSIICQCTQSSLMVNDEYNNCVDISDEEFKNAIRNELGLDLNEELVLIKNN